MNAYTGKILHIDLGTGQSNLYPFTEEDYHKYLGGKIMAAKIISDIVDPTVNPFDHENALVVTTGPFTGTGAPTSNRFNVSGISPATGYLASSNCGGSFGYNLKKAGYDGLILTGKSEKAVWIEIRNDLLKIHDADDLVGSTTTDVQDQLKEIAGKNVGQLVIGPAGENKVLYAGIFSGDRTAARAGLGAIMGDKNVKAIVAHGNFKPSIDQPEKWKEYNKKWIGIIKKHPVTGHALPALGSAMLSEVINKKGVMATRNFMLGYFENINNISGETLAKEYLVKNKGCMMCPIQCGRVVEYEGKNIKGPEFETLGLLGSNIMNDSMEKIIEWNYIADEMGMDTISLGSSIGFAMELNEHGAWDNELEFGKVTNISQVIEDIAYRKGIGNDLADGVKKLSEKYGHKEFAMHSKGLEFSAYEPRKSKGLALGYAVSNRGGCHLNGGYAVLAENALLDVRPSEERGKAELTAFLQNLMEAISASGNCLFAMLIMLPGASVEKPGNFANKFTSSLFKSKLVEVALNYLNGSFDKMAPANINQLIPHPKGLTLITGKKFDLGSFVHIGNRGYTLERQYNTLRGLTRLEDSLPKRMTDSLSDPNDKKSKVNLEYMKDRYYKTRGYDNNGVPHEKTLNRLGIK